MKTVLDRITPRIIGYIAFLTSVLWIVLRLIGDFVWRPAWGRPDAAILVLEGVAAYGIAMVLSFHIAAEYRRGYWLRIAWICFAIKSGIAVFRYAVDDPMLNLIRAGYYESPLSGLARELPMAIALVFLVLGMLAMTRGFLQMGLGFKLLRRDWAAIVGVVAVLAALVYFRQDLSAARWKSLPLALQAQIAVQFLFNAAAGLSIALNRFSMQMGGGDMATAMRCLIIYIVMRVLLVFVSMVLLPAFFGIERENFVTMFLYQASPWLFALAVVYRYQMNLNAAQQAAVLRAQDDARHTIGVAM